MPNRSIKDERNRVGPADPATVRQKLRERLAERESPGLYTKPAAKPAASATRDLSVGGAIKKIQDRKYRIEKATDY